MELTLKQFHKEQGRIYTIQDKLDDINNAGEHDLGTELLMAPKLPREGEDVGGWENAIETMIDFIMDLARCPAAIQKGKEKVSDQTRDTLIAYKKLFEQQQQDVMSGKRDDGTEVIQLPALLYFFITTTHISFRFYRQRKRLKLHEKRS